MAEGAQTMQTHNGCRDAINRVSTSIVNDFNLRFEIHGLKAVAIQMNVCDIHKISALGPFLFNLIVAMKC